MWKSKHCLNYMDKNKFTQAILIYWYGCYYSVSRNFSAEATVTVKFFVVDNDIGKCTVYFLPFGMHGLSVLSQLFGC